MAEVQNISVITERSAGWCWSRGLARPGLSRRDLSHFPMLSVLLETVGSAFISGSPCNPAAPLSRLPAAPWHPSPHCPAWPIPGCPSSDLDTLPGAGSPAGRQAGGRGGRAGFGTGRYWLSCTGAGPVLGSWCLFTPSGKGDGLANTGKPLEAFPLDRLGTCQSLKN